MATTDTDALKQQFRRELFDSMVASYRAEGLGYEPDFDTEFEIWLEMQAEPAQ